MRVSGGDTDADLALTFLVVMQVSWLPIGTTWSALLLVMSVLAFSGTPRTRAGARVEEWRPRPALLASAMALRSYRCGWVHSAAAIRADTRKGPAGWPGPSIRVWRDRRSPAGYRPIILCSTPTPAPLADRPADDGEGSVGRAEEGERSDDEADERGRDEDQGRVSVYQRVVVGWALWSR